MGSMTRSTLISEALELAGDTSLTPRAVQWFNAALAELYAAAPWSFVCRWFGPHNVPAGSTSLIAGTAIGDDADSFVPVRIHSIIKLQCADGANEPLEVALDATDLLPASSNPLLPLAPRQGQPPKRAYVAEPGNAGAWTVTFEYPTDRAYSFAVYAHIIPNDLTSDSDRPAYPNDDTIMAAIRAKAYEHQKDGLGFNEVYRAKVAADRLLYLKTTNAHAALRLSPRFSPAPRRLRQWPP